MFILELTVPWETSVGEAYELKRLKCAEIAAEAEQRGWRTQVLPIEVGCRGFVAASTTKLLKAMGARGQAFRRAVKSGTPGTPDVAVEPSGVCRGPINETPMKGGAHLKTPVKHVHTPPLAPDPPLNTKC